MERYYFKLFNKNKIYQYAYSAAGDHSVTKQINIYNY